MMNIVRWHRWQDGLLFALAIVIMLFVAFCAEHRTPKHLNKIEPAAGTMSTAVGLHPPPLQRAKEDRVFPVYESPVCLSVANYPVAMEKCHATIHRHHFGHVRAVHSRHYHHYHVKIIKHHHKAHHAKHSHQKHARTHFTHHHAGHSGHARSFPAHPR